MRNKKLVDLESVSPDKTSFLHFGNEQSLLGCQGYDTNTNNITQVMTTERLTHYITINNGIKQSDSLFSYLIWLRIK